MVFYRPDGTMQSCLKPCFESAAEPVYLQSVRITYRTEGKRTFMTRGHNLSKSQHTRTYLRFIGLSLQTCNTATHALHGMLSLMTLHINKNEQTLRGPAR